MKSTRRSLGVAALGAALAAACASPGTLPPITETPSAERHFGKIVWHDLITADHDAAQRFYGSLFGWEFEQVGPIYTLIRRQGRPIGGIVRTDRLQRLGRTDYWIASVSVPDVDAAARDVAAAGGRVIEGPNDLPDRGRVAVVADPLGAVFSLVHATSGDPPDREPASEAWLWHEVIARDPATAEAFYTGALSYSLERIERAGGYRMLSREGRRRLGIVDSPFENAPSFWIPYARVGDPAASIARVRELGGSVVLAPSPELRGGSLAVIQDPGGAPLALQKWPTGN